MPISFTAICKSSFNHIQLPYLRATHKCDFLYVFLALWLDILSLICACGALARTLSICLDAMSGGMARIYILGRNSPANEPWPDVLGFSVIFLVSVMFMLGLEVRFYRLLKYLLFFRHESFFKLRNCVILQNSRIFWYIMAGGAAGMTGILISIAWIRGNLESWRSENLLPKGYQGVCTWHTFHIFCDDRPNKTLMMITSRSSISFYTVQQYICSPIHPICHRRGVVEDSSVCF